MRIATVHLHVEDTSGKFGEEAKRRLAAYEAELDQVDSKIKALEDKSAPVPQDLMRRRASLQQSIEGMKLIKDGGNAVTRCNTMLAQLRNSIPGDVQWDRESEATRVDAKLNFCEGIISRLRTELRELG